MKELFFPYGKEKLKYAFDEEEPAGVLTSSIEAFTPQSSAVELVEAALTSPTDSLPLHELVKA